jgi:hypothetical protein
MIRSSIFALVALSTPAFADSTELRSGAMRAVDGGLELGLSTGSATTVGDVGDNMDAGDLIGTAAQLELQVGTRLTPQFGLAFYANGQALTTGSTRSRDVYTGAAGIAATFHVRPHHTIDPWISVGTGLRALMIDDDGLSLGVGVELARIQLGTDFRITEDFALGPVIGASASLYGAIRTPERDFEELDNKGINWTLSAGVAGRFNAFGKRL